MSSGGQGRRSIRGDIGIADLHPTLFVVDPEGTPLGDSGYHFKGGRAVIVDREYPFNAFAVVLDGVMHRALCINLREGEESPWPLKPLPAWAQAALPKD